MSLRTLNMKLRNLDFILYVSTPPRISQEAQIPILLLQINESINSGIKCIWDLLQSRTFLLKLLPCSLAFESSERTYRRKKRKERGRVRERGRMRGMQGGRKRGKGKKQRKLPFQLPECAFHITFRPLMYSGIRTQLLLLSHSGKR